MRRGMTLKKKQTYFLPCWWYIGLLFLAAFGLYLIWPNPYLPKEFAKLSTRVCPDAWSRFGGILILSVVITHLVLFATSRLLRKLLQLHGDESQADMLSPALVGICESVMYPTVLFLGKPEFIGVWLAVKVAGQWVRWKGDPGQSSKTGESSVDDLNEGRRRFNGFLVGNSLMIILGIATWGALKIWVLL
jgi:hypothetical protein